MSSAITFIRNILGVDKERMVSDTDPLPVTIVSGGAGGGSSVDRELLITTYTAKANSTGITAGDVITSTQIVNVTTGTPAIEAVLWFNQSTNLPLASAPASSNLALSGSNTVELGASTLAALEQITAITGGLTNTELRATPINTYCSNVVTKFREAFETYAPNGAKWLETKATGDIIYVEGNTAGASYLVISKDPLTAGTESKVESVARFAMPIEASVGIHMSQRTLGQEFSFEIVSDDSVTVPNELTILNIAQAASVVTINFATNHGLKIGQRVGIYGVSDSRLNYPNLVVATTPLPSQITLTAGAGGTIPSLTIAQINNSGFITYRPAVGWSQDGTSLIFENATATNASVYVRSESGDVFPSGSIAGNHSITIQSTASVQAVNAIDSASYQPTTEFKLALLADRLQWSNAPVDTSAQATLITNRSQVVPTHSVPYKLRIRARNEKGLSIPVGQIVSVSKTGTTTATIVFDRAHGLTITDQIVAYGVRDQTNFANLTAATAIASIVNATTITVVWGAAVTATSFGGYAARTNGGNLQSSLGANAVVAQAAVLTTLTDGRRNLNLAGNTTWAGFQVSELVNLVGCRNNVDGSTMNLDGVYKVRNFSTTSLDLEPVSVSSLPADFGSTNCGGGIIKRTDFRISFIRVFNYDRERVEIIQRPASDVYGAVPVAVNNIPAVTVNSGTITTVSAVTSVTSSNTAIPGSVADVASAALTTTTTTAAVTPGAGNAYEVNIPVTVVTGTTPTLDVDIEESDDTGTNWYKVYSFPRITAVGMYRSPKIPLKGNRIRYVQTVGGTSPSFTRAVNRLQISDNVDEIRQIIDRTIVLNTLNSVTPSINTQNCKNVQIVLSQGAGATTNPQIQLEGSEDGGLTWYSIGAPLVGVVSASVQLTVNNINAQLVRGRISTAGVLATINYVLIKGFA